VSQPIDVIVINNTKSVRNNPMAKRTLRNYSSASSTKETHLGAKSKGEGNRHDKEKSTEHGEETDAMCRSHGEKSPARYLPG
jgi:hypothetical protein